MIFSPNLWEWKLYSSLKLYALGWNFQNTFDNKDWVEDLSIWSSFFSNCRQPNSEGFESKGHTGSIVCAIILTQSRFDCKWNRCKKMFKSDSTQILNIVVFIMNFQVTDIIWYLFGFIIYTNLTQNYEIFWQFSNMITDFESRHGDIADNGWWFSNF